MSRITAVSLQEKKRGGEAIAVLTAYDYPSARLQDEAGIDVILVGDSCAMTVMGLPDTLGMTMDAMVHHTAMVSRAARRALVVADMPFLSYQVSPEDAVRNAGRLIVEGGAQAVKLEGGIDKFGPAITAILRAGIPVMGHLGLTPQSIHQLGGYGLQAQDQLAREELKKAARDLEQTGCFALVLEKVPADLAKDVSEALSIPTIGIGAGPDCDGQVLVMHDMLGLGLKAKHTKLYADLAAIMREAFKAYVVEVKAGDFPNEEHSYS